MFTRSELMAKHAVEAVFSDRVGGCSKEPYESLNLGLGIGDDEAVVAKNLSVLCEESELPAPHQSTQVHGHHVLHCSGPGMVWDKEADILIASDTNVCLAVRTADCLPLLLADVKHGVIAAVHAGWKGTVAQVAQKALRAMYELGASPECILASLGPCIASCCFKVDEGVASQLQASCGQSVSSLQSGSCYANLYQANILQLKSMGVPDVHIETSPFCTACQKSPQYFSYRRDKGRTGRQLSMIMLR